MSLDLKIVAGLRAALVGHLQEAALELGHVTTSKPDDALITYGDLVKRSGLNVQARGIGPHLTRIGDECGSLPRLDVLVVNRRGRTPGRRFGSKDEWWRMVVRCLESAQQYVR